MQQTNLEKQYRKKGCDHKKKNIELIINAHNITIHKTRSTTYNGQEEEEKGQILIIVSS